MSGAEDHARRLARTPMERSGHEATACLGAGGDAAFSGGADDFDLERAAEGSQVKPRAKRPQKASSLSFAAPGWDQNVRKALDAQGFKDVRIIVSGGFTVEKISEFERLGVPVVVGVARSAGSLEAAGLHDASAVILTANDDAGGGTYQVIEALRDRIDVVVKALHFNPRFLGELLARIEALLRRIGEGLRECCFGELDHVEPGPRRDRVQAGLVRELGQPVGYFTSGRPPGGERAGAVFLRSFK
mgnify:CR=1 FL=1